MNKIKKALAALATASIVVGAPVVLADSASAGSHTAATINNFLNSAWYNARNTGTLAPMSNSDVVTKGDTWCYDKGRYGAATAYRYLGQRIGTSKANAIGKAADAWFC